MAYTKYSLTPSSNTAAPPDGAPEGMLPSAVNDTMRDMMAQIRDCGDGIRDGTYTMTAPKITGGTITGVAFTGNTFTSPVISGGSINNATIGAATANTGAFTTLSATGVTTVQAGTVSAPAITTSGDTNTGIFFPAADTIAFAEGGVESMRITSGGQVLIGDTATVANERLYVLASASTGFAFRFYNSQATAANTFGQYVYYSGSSPNGTGNQFFRCDDSTTTRAEIRSNGGLANYSANNVNLSDERTKKDIQLAGNYLDKICAIPVKTFLYKDQTDTDLNLGVVAQDVETIAPELVDKSGFGETPEDGVPLKAIYQTDLQYALMKCIQELNAKVEAQAVRIAALESK